MLMYPLSLFIPTKKRFICSPFHVWETLPHISDITRTGNFVFHYTYIDQLRLFPSLSVCLCACAFQLHVQFILFRVLCDHVGFPCRIFISHERPHHQCCLLVCCFSTPLPTLFLLMAVRVYLCDCCMRFMLGYPRITSCYYIGPTPPLLNFQWRTI